MKLTFFLTHDDERAPAAAASGEGEKSARALRWIDPETRSTDLDVLVCIAADRIPQIKLCSGVRPPDLSPFSSAPSPLSSTVATDATIRSICWPLRDDRPSGQLCAPWYSRRRMEKDRVLLVHSRRQCNKEERGQGEDDTKSARR